MWDIEAFRPASGDACNVAAFLREAVAANELGDSRLPDFVSLSVAFGKTCLPFREHGFESLAPHVYDVLRKRGKGEIVILENPLYEDSSEYFGVADLGNDGELRTLINEQLFAGGYIISTVTPLFRWIGNFTDYGFMFTDATVIEAIFQVPALTTYSLESQEFRVAQSGDLLLDAEIRKLDKIWSTTP
jgi:hypothetical protein